MPELVNPTLWRTAPYSTTLYAVLVAPVVVFRARVNMAVITYPLAAIDFDDVTVGSYNDVLAGMTVLVGTTPGGDDLGRQRVRADATALSIPVGWSSQGNHDGELDIIDDAYITVLDDHRVWARIPRVTSSGAVYKDYDIPLGDNGLHPPPVAVAGPHVADFVDTTTGLLTVDFDGTSSWCTDPGATIASYSWSFPGGTPDSAATGTVPGVTFTPGPHWVRLTVTDSNGHTGTAWRMVYAAERTGAYAPLSNWELTSRVLRPEGQRIGLRVLQDIPATTYPDGSMLLIWQREVYGSAVGSLAGPPGRAHMVFAGWHQTDEASIEAGAKGLVRDTTLDFLDVAGRLATLPGFPQVMERTGTPTTWLESAHADIGHYVYYLLNWHSTALELADFLPAQDDLDDYYFASLTSDGQNLYSQADRVARAAGYRLTCDRFGRLFVRPDPMLLAGANRTSTVIVPLTEDDYQSLRQAHTRPPRVHWRRGGGVTRAYDEALATPVFSISPGHAPGQGESAQENYIQIVRNLDELCTREGMRYARENAVDGIIDLDLAHNGDAGIDPAYLEWVTLTVSAATAAQRGWTYTAVRALPLEVTYRYDAVARTARQRVRLEVETSGPGAVADPRPDAGLPAYRSGGSLYPRTWRASGPTGVESLNLNVGVQRMAVFDDTGHVYRTSDFQTPAAQGGPTWDDVDLGVDGIPCQFVVDASSYLDTGGIDGWLITSTNIYYITDIFGSTPGVANQHTFTVETLSRSADASFGAPGVLAVCSYYGPTQGANQGVRCTYTTNGGATWAAEVTVTSHYHDDVAYNGGVKPGCYVSSKTPGLVYTSAYTATGTSGVQTAALHVSQDYGATWALCNGTNGPVGDCGSDIAGDIHVPYHNNGSERVCYWGNTIDADLPGGPAQRLFRTLDGTTQEDISPTSGGDTFGPYITSRWVFHSGATNRLSMAAVLLRAGLTYGVWTSTDGGDSWVLRVFPTDYRRVAVAGDNPDVLYLFGVNVALGYSADGGNTIDSRVGNLASFSPGEFIGICGG